MLDSSTLLPIIGATKTNFATISIPQTANGVNYTQGRPIGNGKCKAVMLRLNALFRNSTSAVYSPSTIYYSAGFYLGDQNRQEYEVLAGTNSPLIICNDLSEVWVRLSQAVLIVSELPLSLQMVIYE